jgi:DNA-binding winged helix-turn-helix (wHTH) protein
LDLDAERLWRDGKEVPLRRKPFAILRYLVQNPQRLVTHAEIIDAVWGKVAMSESLLRTHVHDLRNALGEGIVETVLGRGYRFVAEIDHAYAEDGASNGPREPSTIASRIVGREREIDALQAALRSARDQRRTTVFVSGEAGVGKTTLVDAFLETAGASLVGRGACVEQYGTGQAFLPVLDAIGALCRGRGGTRAIDVLSEHAPTWLSQMPGLVRGARFAELQRRASGASQVRSLRELAEALDALSAPEPVVLVFDDLHWTDPSTAALLAFLASRREPARVLIVATYRSGEVPRGHPVAKITGELVAHRQASTIALDGLGLESVDAYLTKRFPRHRLPPALGATLHQSTGGNPLFITTLVDDLEAQGLLRERDGEWELATSVQDVAARRPDSIRRLIDTQIDRLPAAEQRIIEVAAVAGMTFTAGVVAHALDADADGVDSACESLANERRLLHYVDTETWPDGTIQSRYAFGHSLFQHAALMRSTSATVRAWHRKIGERLETGYAQREEEVAAELAVHFDRGQVPAKAARYHLAAGDRAGRRYGLHESVAHYERVRALIEGLPDGRERHTLEMRAALGLGWQLYQREGLPVVAMPLLEKARELAAGLGDEASLADALIRLEMLSLARGDSRKASEHARAAAPLLELLPDLLRPLAKELEAFTTLIRGDVKDACRRFEAIGIFRVAEETAAPEPAVPRIAAMAWGGYALWLAGKPDEAIASMRRGYEAASALNDPLECAALLSDWATLHAWRREPAKAKELAQRSLDVAGQGAFGLWARRADLVLRWAEAELGAPLCDERRELVKTPWEGVWHGQTMASVLLAAIYARSGRANKALEVLAEALASIETSEERWLEPELHRLRGELLQSKDAAEAERSIAAALEIARQQSSASLELRAALSLHAISTGAKKERAREHVARALSRITGGSDAPDVVEAHKVVAGN